MSLRERALEYAAAGVPVFPCKPGDKAPLTSAGFKDATTKLEVINAWWTQWPNANIGAPVTGDEIVIDLDPKHGGDESLARLEARYGQLPCTFTVRTGSDGSHRRYKYSGPPVKWRKNLDKHGFPGIDIKTEGGYVLLPSSYTTDEVRKDNSGKVWGKGRYEVINDSALAELPDWFVELATHHANSQCGETSDRVDAEFVLTGIPGGTRNNELWRYACSMRARNLPRVEAVQLLHAAMGKCGYERETPEDMIDRAWKYPPGVSGYDGEQGHIEMSDEDEPAKDEMESDLPAFPQSAWRGVFGDYRDLMHDITECPEVFHFANLLTVVGSLAGDTFRLMGGNAPYLNFYTLCLGKSGTKKSTATDLCREYILDKLPSGYAPHVITSVSSTEGLIRILNDHRNAFLCYDELAKLMKVVGWSGSTLESSLCEAINLKTLHSNVKKQKESLEAANYYFGLLACGTPAHIRLKLTEDTFSGGLLNRFLVFAAKPTGIVKPLMGTPDDMLNRYVIGQLTQTVQAWPGHGPGEVRLMLSDEARSIHAAWYSAHTKMMQDGDDLKNDPLTRLDFYVKKVAMVYAYLENAKSGDPYITGEQMQAAVEVIGYCKAGMQWMTKQWTGPKTLQQQSQHISEQRVEAYLREHGCMRERSLYRALHVDAKELREVLKAMSGLTVNIVGSGSRTIHYIPKCRCVFPNTRTREAA